MDDSKTTHTRSDAQGKLHEPDSHLFEPATADAWGKTPLRLIQHISTQITKSYKSEEIALELVNADQRLMDRCKALLEAGGIKTDDVEVTTYGVHSYLKIPNATQDDLIRVAVALSSTVDAPDRTTHYPLLPRTALNEIIDIAAGNMNITPLITLHTIEMEAERAALYGVENVPKRYIDVDISDYAGSPVRYIREASQPIEKDGKPTFEPISILEVDPARISQLGAVFKKSGIGFQENGAVISVEATSKAVINALDENDVLPHHFSRAFD